MDSTGVAHLLFNLTHLLKVMAGPGVEKGRELKRPVDTFDTAATVVNLLGVKPHSCWIGKVVTEALVLSSGR